MKVAIIGGTGKMGIALAKHLSRANQVIIASRDPAKAQEAAKKVPGAEGMDYVGASREADAVIVAIPFSSLATAASIAGEVKGKLVISIVNPMKFENGILWYALEKGSAAEQLARLLPGARVATAFNNVSQVFFDADEVVPMDILIAAESKETYYEAAKLVSSIPNMRPLYAGPLSQAEAVERLTALVLNLRNLNGSRSLTTRFATKKDTK